MEERANPASPHGMRSASDAKMGANSMTGADSKMGANSKMGADSMMGADGAMGVAPPRPRSRAREAQKQADAETAPLQARLRHLTHDRLTEGILMAEILGRPVSKRHGPRR